MGVDDLGRDIIARKESSVILIQCKYWSTKKVLHENHINQLFGTVISYKIENELSDEQVHGMLVTNTQLSDRAKEFAKRLNIEYRENVQLENYPRIKCNIGRNEYGGTTKIYHLPFDQQYDNTEIKNPGEFYAFTIEEAENAGFRRAHKWYGNAE